MKETILLVDDEQQVRVHVGLTLRNAGYAVLTAGSGEEALQTFARRRTSIAIVDAGLADLSGLELLKRWKAIAPDTEIILTLDRDKLDLAGESLKLEASDVLFRPVDPEVLLIVVKRAQERISMRSELHECTINLESVIKRLLFVREAANITHILGDGDKRAKTLGMAEALAGFTGNPAVVRLVQTGVIAAWAYVESILDIRALLAGDKIALIKTETQWTAQFGSLAAAFEDGKKAKNCENGVSYQGYLKGFLYTVSSERLAYRMMDIMERTVRLHPMYADCRMDHVLCVISYRMDYEWQPLFSGLMVHTGRDLSGLCYQTQRTFSYD